MSIVFYGRKQSSGENNSEKYNYNNTYDQFWRQ